MQNHAPYGVPVTDRHHMMSHLGQEMTSATTTTVPSRGYSTSHNQKVFANTDFDSEFGEDVDDDFTDEECQYSFENFVQKKAEQAQKKEETATGRLLAFLELVNTDIRKYFGRNKGSDDACDVYQDKWTSGKSGRELYYADLMKIAQGLDTEDPKSPPKSDAALQEQRNSDKTATGASHTGRLDPSTGLGPLESLFQCGGKTGGSVTKKGGNGKRQLPQPKRSKGVKVQESSKRAKTTLPMVDRKLPKSFWSEPKQIMSRHAIHNTKLDCAVGNSGHNNSIELMNTGNKCVNPKRLNSQVIGGGGSNLGQTSVPLDFADFLDCWGDVTHTASCTPGGQQQHYGAATRGQHGVPATAAT